jgi:hypothetical protein
MSEKTEPQPKDPPMNKTETVKKKEEILRRSQKRQIPPIGPTVVRPIPNRRVEPH